MELFGCHNGGVPLVPIWRRQAFPFNVKNLHQHQMQYGPARSIGGIRVGADAARQSMRRSAAPPDPLWRCPRCRGLLEEIAKSLACENCRRAFPVIDGIPDLRLSIPSWIDA